MAPLWQYQSAPSVLVLRLDVQTGESLQGPLFRMWYAASRDKNVHLIQAVVQEFALKLILSESWFIIAHLVDS